MAKTLNQHLAEYKDSDVTVRILKGMFSIMPFAPEFQLYTNLEGAAQRMGVDASVAAKASQLAGTEDIVKALWIAETLDTGDKLIAGYAGVKNLLSIFSSGPRKRTFESDPEQAADAALKGAGLAYMVYKLFPGEIPEKVKAFQSTPAGQEIALYYATAEVGLPFADNLAEAGTGLVKKLIGQNQSGVGRFAQLAGGDALNQATSVINGLFGDLEDKVTKAKEYIGPVADKIKGYMPAGMNVADSATGAVATGMDFLPIWTFLGARLAAEASILRSM